MKRITSVFSDENDKFCNRKELTLCIKRLLLFILIGIFSFSEIFGQKSHISSRHVTSQNIASKNFIKSATDKFLIGSFFDPSDNPTSPNPKLPQKLDEFKAAYFNLLTGTNLYDTVKDQMTINYARKVLHLASSRQLLCMLLCNLTTAKDIRSFIGSLTSSERSAFYGYYLKDEPSTNDFDHTRQTILAYQPGKLSNEITYINLFPHYAQSALPHAVPDYSAYLKKYIQATSAGKNLLDVVSYDFYPFLKDSIRYDYFYNLKLIRRMAFERPLWCHIHATGEQPGGPYLDPKEYNLAFETFCSLAYGSKGLIYFTYETIWAPGFWHPALINEYQLRTQKYFIAQKINRYIAKIAGPIIMADTYRGTFHKSSRPYPNQFLADQLVSSQSLIDLSNDNFLVGIFQNKLNKGYDLFVVNKANLKQAVSVKISGYFKTAKVSHSYENYEDSDPPFETVALKPDLAKRGVTECTLSFLPGEGRFIRLLP